MMTDELVSSFNRALYALLIWFFFELFISSSVRLGYKIFIVTLPKYVHNFDFTRCFVFYPTLAVDAVVLLEIDCFTTILYLTMKLSLRKKTLLFKQKNLLKLRNLQSRYFEEFVYCPADSNF